MNNNTIITEPYRVFTGGVCPHLEAVSAKLAAPEYDDVFIFRSFKFPEAVRLADINLQMLQECPWPHKERRVLKFPFDTKEEWNLIFADMALSAIQSNTALKADDKVIWINATLEHNIGRYNDGVHRDNMTSHGEFGIRQVASSIEGLTTKALDTYPQDPLALFPDDAGDYSKLEKAVHFHGKQAAAYEWLGFCGNHNHCGFNPSEPRTLVSVTTYVAGEYAPVYPDKSTDRNRFLNPPKKKF